MKTLLLASIVILVTVQIAYPQGAKDYFIPLRVGNYLIQHTDNLPEGVKSSTVRIEIEDIDIIGEKEYFRMKLRIYT